MNKRLSKYNIIAQLKDSSDYVIINSLSGNADAVNSEIASKILTNTLEDNSEFIDKGYVLSEVEEKKLFKEAYLKFLEERDRSEVQIFFVPNYSCNFSCSYCYQDEYGWDNNALTCEVIDAFFDHIRIMFAGRQKYITIFGGEPLLNNDHQRNMISKILHKANTNSIDIAIVTNGYYLKEYIPILEKARIREIQVTLDGTADVHNKRRYLKNKEGTFNKIVEGIALSLEKKIPINLRIVIDKENINELIRLTKFAIEKGWTKNAYFKTQIGRNYELHHCQENNERLFSRIELYEHIYNLALKNPEIFEFHKPAFSISRYLFENGELPKPLYDSCPGCKTEWAYDYSGKIYPCTATVGKEDEAVGTFYPEISLDNEKIDLWVERDVTSISECKNCNIQHLCGGGCASVAKNKKGSILNSDCRPIKELISMGISLYFKEGK